MAGHWRAEIKRRCTCSPPFLNKSWCGPMMQWLKPCMKKKDGKQTSYMYLQISANFAVILCTLDITDAKS
ncbi:hypothetical protein J5N97_027428 [Dioscorea zingiberensis]|uniref:Uncharacterized protein n=1 Tax=Dioscorea zingiberensis TaxID=325984 RepID=A0A9D5C447_9LILI|nr:hypothetical protein J5N97_027428 [Dioscorea zingiberensis]